MTPKHEEKKLKNYQGIIFFSIVWLVGFYCWYDVPKETAVLWFVPHRTPLLTYFFLIATHLGEAYPYIAAILLFGFLKKYQEAVQIAIAGGGAILISNFLKDCFQIPRPILYLEYSDLGIKSLGHIEGVTFLSGATSFPSGHTIGAFVFYTSLAYLLPSRFQVTLLCIAVASGISRIYLGHHFLEDVLAGSLIGVVWASFVYFSLQKVKKLPIFKAKEK